MVAYWLKLVGTVDRPVPEHWTRERGDLLKEIRFSERHPPDPIARGDSLVYHAVVARCLFAVAEVTDTEARYEPAVGMEQWPLVRTVRVLFRVGRLSQAPSTDVLGLREGFAHQSFLRLSAQQFEAAIAALNAAGTR